MQSAFINEVRRFDASLVQKNDMFLRTALQKGGGQWGAGLSCLAPEPADDQFPVMGDMSPTHTGKETNC